ncbi:MAG TPA: 3-isopropylmalate dehydratase small subunit [Candidatus Binataceae bacterium]|nr:3-isopropylmalate dehydratase small subunit [Candidatus Binataceae bacterium]
MKAFKNFTGLVAPIDQASVDTDQIIPKQFLKAVVRTGLKKGLFFDRRLNPDGSENRAFVLNQPRFRDSTILVARANFGCGSSREHAVWALADFGFRALISPVFADIFRNNCLKNGVLPIVLPNEDVDHIFKSVSDYEAYRISIDLDDQTITDDFGWSAHFEIDPYEKRCLLEGLDDIALTLAHEHAIADYEAKHPIPYRL